MIVVLKCSCLYTVAGTSNSSLPNSSKCAEEITHGDGNAAMWVPSDSDSGSEKNEEIGSEIELDSCEGEKMDCSNEDYSFDILDTKKSLNGKKCTVCLF